MAVRQLKDGRWTCYYRIREGKRKGKLRVEYFGRGSSGEAAARKRNDGLGLLTRRPPRWHYGPTLGDLAKAYVAAKDFNANSLKMLIIRLSSTILPELGHREALYLSARDLDRYVNSCRRTVKDSTIRRELTDIKAILNWPLRAIGPSSRCTRSMLTGRQHPTTPF